MIELIFSDGGGANLGLAKQRGDKSRITCGMTIVDADGQTTFEDVMPEPYLGPYVPGDTAEVAPLLLFGDVGDISHLSDGLPRLEILRQQSKLYGIEENGWIEQAQQEAKIQMNRLQIAAETGEPVRVWWSSVATETCGFYWAMDFLRDAKGPVTAVKVPRMMPERKERVTVDGTADLAPEEFVGLLGETRTISVEARRAFGAHWRMLVRENAPLRGVVNDLPVSVPETFYDELLYRAFSGGSGEDGVVAADVIGQAMISGPGGVPHWWLLGRLHHMIDTGILTVQQEHERFFMTRLGRFQGPTGGGSRPTACLL